jgi:hypothetical protein
MALRPNTAMRPSEYAEFLLRFKPYAAEMGYVAIMWNAIHAKLAEFFTLLLDRKNPKIGRAIWQTFRSERAQRDALSATARVTLAQHRSHLADFLWLLWQIEMLSSLRNDAVHSALVLASDFTAMPHPTADTSRHRRLKGKDLQKEFQLYRDDLNAVRCYAIDLHLSTSAELGIQGLSRALPQRPLLQSISQS